MPGKARLNILPRVPEEEIVSVLCWYLLVARYIHSISLPHATL